MEHFAKWSVVVLMLWSTFRWGYTLIKMDRVKYPAAWTLGILLNVWIIVAVMVWWQP